MTWKGAGVLTVAGSLSNKSSDNSIIVRVSSPIPESSDLDLKLCFEKALDNLPWMAFQKFIEQQGMYSWLPRYVTLSDYIQYAMLTAAYLSRMIY